MNEMRVSCKIPLVKMNQSDVTVRRILREYGKRESVAFSKSSGLYYGCNGWVKDLSFADALPLEEMHEKMKDSVDKSIVYLLVKF